MYGCGLVKMCWKFNILVYWVHRKYLKKKQKNTTKLNNFTQNILTLSIKITKIHSFTSWVPLHSGVFHKQFVHLYALCLLTKTFWRRTFYAKHKSPGKITVKNVLTSEEKFTICVIHSEIFLFMRAYFCLLIQVKSIKCIFR